MSDPKKEVKFDDDVKVIDVKKAEYARMFRELKRSPRVTNIEKPVPNNPPVNKK